MSVENKTEIELLRILYQNSEKKPTKNLITQRAYPVGIERKYYYRLRSYFKPLFTYVKNYLKGNGKEILRGDSGNVRLDAIPGDSFDDMIYSLENWLDTYMPDKPQTDDFSIKNTIYLSLDKTANEVKEFNDKELKDVLVKSIHVNLPINAEWWGKMMESWKDNNYSLITSNARNYVSKINSLVESAVVNGKDMLELKKEIEKATNGLSDAHCRLLARDQIGKLNGLIHQAQMEELGLKLYVWDTSMDERVRESHRPMQGLLCRWDNARVCSYDGGVSWVSRPSGAVQLHPGQDFQCRCSALVYNPELIAQLEGKPMEIVSAEQLGKELMLSQSKDLILYNPNLGSNEWKILSRILPEEASTLEGLYKLAEEAKNEFVESVNGIMKGIKDIIPLMVKQATVRGKSEVIEFLKKLQSDYERHGGTYSKFYNWTDNTYNPRYANNVLYTVIAFKTLMDLQKALFGFLDDDKVIRISNNFALENKVKYGNVIINMILSNGIIAEVELNTIANFVAYGYGDVLNDVYEDVSVDAEFIPLADALKKILKNLYEFSTELSDGDFTEADEDIFDFDYEPYVELIKRDLEKLIPDYKKALDKGLISKVTEIRFKKLCDRIGIEL